MREKNKPYGRRSMKYDPPGDMTVGEHDALIGQIQTILQNAKGPEDKEILRDVLSVIPQHIKTMAKESMTRNIGKKRPSPSNRKGKLIGRQQGGNIRTRPVVSGRARKQQGGKVRRQQGGNGNNLPKPWSDDS